MIIVQLDSEQLGNLILNAVKRAITEKNNEGIDSAGSPLLSIQQAAELLSLSVPTIYGYVSRREIPHSRRGKRLYCDRSELIAWISEGKRKTISETIAAADETLAVVGKKRKGLYNGK